MHETAPTQFVQVGDVRVAYRRLGKRGALPLLLLYYIAANMDDWDPKITNGLAAQRDVKSLTILVSAVRLVRHSQR